MRKMVTLLTRQGPFPSVFVRRSHNSMKPGTTSARRNSRAETAFAGTHGHRCWFVGSVLVRPGMQQQQRNPGYLGLDPAPDLSG